MEQCFKCKFTFSLNELEKFSSGRNYCQTCVLESFYKCEDCGKKFLIGDFSTEYKEGKKLAWKSNLEHQKIYHS